MLAAETQGLRMIGQAFEQAADDRASAARLMEALAARRNEIDLPSTVWALQCMTGLLSEKTGETPRSILASELASAPSDEFWQADFELGPVPGGPEGEDVHAAMPKNRLWRRRSLWGDSGKGGVGD